MRFSRNLHVGPGGIKCSCCMWAKGSTPRYLEFRAAKRRDTREAFRVEFDTIGEDSDLLSDRINTGPIDLRLP